LIICRASREPWKGLKLRSAAIDGEASVIGEDGLSDHFTLHAALARKSVPRAVLVAFDLMHLDGEDMRGRVLEGRRAVLADVINKRAPWLQFSESLEGDGPQVWRAACGMGLEGIISKQRGCRYFSGKTDAWRKTKCTITDHFAVTGYDRQGRSPRLSRFLDRGLVPCGSAGSGLTDADARRIRAALDARYAVIVTAEYRGFTPDGELRHPVIREWYRGCALARRHLPEVALYCGKCSQFLPRRLAELPQGINRRSSAFDYVAQLANSLVRFEKGIDRCLHHLIRAFYSQWPGTCAHPANQGV
jgi:hypothetical protein